MNFESLVTAFIPLLTYLAGKWIYDRARANKLNAEAGHITKTDNLSLFEASEKSSREYRELFNKAEKEIREARRHLLNAEHLVKEMILTMRTNNIESWQEFQNRGDKLFSEANSGA